MLSTFGAVRGTAADTVAVTIEGPAEIAGGKQTIVQRADTPEAWCAYYGVRVENGMALVYKGVRDNYKSMHGGDYTPGSIPREPEWDKGARECGPGGLHFSAHPKMTLQFDNGITRFMGCWVKLEEMAVHPDGDYPSKTKTAGAALPVFEVDEDGEPLPVKQTEDAA